MDDWFVLFGLPIITHAYEAYLKHSIKRRHLRRNSPWDRGKEAEKDAERLHFGGSHSTLLLNHSLSLPCLLFLIVRAALQYFYQMISPSSSAALMFMKMILHRNAFLHAKMLLSFLIACIYQCVCAGSVIVDWLALFIITRGCFLRWNVCFCTWGSFSFPQPVCLCKCFIAVSVWSVTDMLKVHLLPLLSTPQHTHTPTPKESLMEPNDSCRSSTWHAHFISTTHTHFLSYSCTNTRNTHTLALCHMLRY